MYKLVYTVPEQDDTQGEPGRPVSSMALVEGELLAQKVSWGCVLRSRPLKRNQPRWADSSQLPE